MGVPTVTLYGEGIQSRGAARMNNVLNLSEFNSENGKKDTVLTGTFKLAKEVT